MDLGLAERVAIVGGAGRDIGKQVAMTLASEGVKVAICARNEDGLRLAEMDVARVGTQHNVLAMPADLSEPRDIRRVVRDTVNRFGQLDILVVRSGPSARPSLSDIEDNEMTEEVEKNLLSAVRLTREVIPYMKQEHWGRIINLELASTRHIADGFNQASARQLYLIGYFKSLAQELAPFNITVNSLLTGALETEELKDFLKTRAESENRDYAELSKQTTKRVPMKRLGKPEEIGDMVAFLASDRAGYLTGAAISVDGGQSH